MRKRIPAAIAAIAMTAMSISCKPLWISPADNHDAESTWMCFQKEIDVRKLPKTVPVRISADSKYWLWINGRQVVIEGGVKRGPNPDDSYCDSLDLRPYLHKGKNLVSVMVWYFGKVSFSYKPSGKGALLIDSPALPQLDTDASWTGVVHPSFYIPEGDVPNMRLPESNIGFDARKDIAGWEKTKQMWQPVVERGAEGDAPWGKLHDRVIPQWKDYGVTPYVKVDHRKGAQTDTIIATLPYDCQAMPVINIANAPEGRVIDIRTDNYIVSGCPNVRAEYVTRDGAQSYENPGWMNGHKVIYTFPSDVEVESVAFRETGYGCDFTGTFECSDDFLNRFRQKALRTLYVTMRDTYMDCPDRERSQWWGDEVNESGQAFYALSPSAAKLTKKGMYELIGWQRPDNSIFAPVPASNWDAELPGQMLASVGCKGFWNYILNTGDMQASRDLYDGVRRYLSIWQKAPDGTMADRNVGWHWGDWGDNIDKVALYNAFYYMAQEGLRQMALANGNTAAADSLTSEMASLKDAFNRVFWNGKAYRHPEYKEDNDDRVQALAVVAGLADPDKYPAIFEVLKTTEHASPYTEKYVLEALYLMGHGDYALERLKKRFGLMVDDPNYTTLFEGWGYDGGSNNHAWSGGGLTILSQYTCGISPVEPGYAKFRVAPDLRGLKADASGKSWIRTTVPSVKGNIPFEATATPDGAVTYTVEIPKGTVAELTLPAGTTSGTLDGRQVRFPMTVTRHGRHTVTAR